MVLVFKFNPLHADEFLHLRCGKQTTTSAEDAKISADRKKQSVWTSLGQIAFSNIGASINIAMSITETTVYI